MQHHLLLRCCHLQSQLHSTQLRLTLRGFNLEGVERGLVHAGAVDPMGAFSAGMATGELRQRLGSDGGILGLRASGACRSHHRQKADFQLPLHTNSSSAPLLKEMLAE